MNNSFGRFVSAAVLLIAVGVFLQAHSGSEVSPPRLALQSFPQQIEEWTGGENLTIDDETLEVLKPSDYLVRIYSSPDQRQPDIDLYIAYFASQRTGETIHSPKNCLPGAGWSPVESNRLMLSTPGHDPFPVNRYIIAKGDSRQLVLYWYWAHNRGVASEYLSKYYLVADSIKLHRSDGSLVRVATTLLPGEGADSAARRLVPFAAGIVPLLQNYVPR